MQQEDDLRGLAKVMEFMRAISIIFIVVHIYWFCYQAIVDMARINSMTFANPLKSSSCCIINSF